MIQMYNMQVCLVLLKDNLVLSSFINPIGASDLAWGAIATFRKLMFFRDDDDVYYPKGRKPS